MQTTNDDAGATAPKSLLIRCAFLIGSIALLFAMATDAVAVLGRHIGVPILGSIELVQACIVLAASASMVIATLHESHARVHILTERLSQRSQRRLAQAADLTAAAVFVIVAAGSAWMLSELWFGHEETELLKIPVRWLRLFWVAAALTIAGLFVVRTIRRK